MPPWEGRARAEREIMQATNNTSYQYIYIYIYIYIYWCCRHRCMPQIDLNWKINAIAPGRSVEDARIGNTLVYEELFAACIMLFNVDSLYPGLKTKSAFYAHPYAPICTRTKDSHRTAVPYPSPRSRFLGGFRKSTALEGGTWLAKLLNGWDFCDFPNIALSQKFAANRFLRRLTVRSGHRR
jgi:hypothetical protein